MGGVPGLPNNPANILKEAVLPVITAPVLAAKALYKNTDPLGIDGARKRGEKAQEEMQRKQDSAAAAQAEALRTAPKKMDRQTVAPQERRLRAGVAANIRAAGLGPAPLAPAALSGKPKLGQ